MKQYNIKAIKDKDKNKELIESLENEIKYYKHEINSLKNVHREDVEYINKQEKQIKEYQEAFKEIVINKKDILNIRTPNQIRKLLGFNEVKNNKEAE